jgi:hypothetical protein
MRSMLSSMTGSGKPPQQNDKDLDFDDEARALFERYRSFDACCNNRRKPNFLRVITLHLPAIILSGNVPFSVEG